MCNSTVVAGTAGRQLADRPIRRGLGEFFIVNAQWNFEVNNGALAR